MIFIQSFNEVSKPLCHRVFLLPTPFKLYYIWCKAVGPTVNNLQNLSSYFRCFKELGTNVTYLYTISI